MPWEVTGPVRERERFIEAYLTGLYSITELAERFGMSRQKLHKWLARHNVDGMKGLSCDLNQVLPLRGSPRSTHETMLFAPS